MGLPQARSVTGGSIRDEKLADDAMATVDRDVVLVAECRNGDVDLLLLAVLCRPGLRELHRPAGVCVQRWLGLSEQARGFDKWIDCRVYAAARSGWLKEAWSGVFRPRLECGRRPL